MKAFKYSISIILLFAVVLAGCKKDFFSDLSFVQSAAKAGNLGAMFHITQDNSGLVTITPVGEGALRYDVSFGDTSQTVVTLTAGKSVQHIYAEGVYQVKVAGYDINGNKTEATQELTVSFRAPENMKVNVSTTGLTATLSASAQYETFFRVFYGDSTSSTPEPYTDFLEGQSISHVYPAAGDYQMRVLAMSGGTEFTEYDTTIHVSIPLDLPVTFDDPNVDYTVSDFGGNQSSLDVDPADNTNHVLKSIKTAGAEVWAGTTIGPAIGFAHPIPFTPSTMRISLRVYSPAPGIDVKMKVEDHNDGTHSVETDVLTTQTNGWETLIFDFTKPAAGTAAYNSGYTYDKASVFYDFGNPGDGRTYYCDDLKMAPPTLSQINLPVTFEDPTVDYTVTDFGGNSTVDAVDPTNNANHVKASTKTAGAQVWAGTTVGTAAGFATAIPLTSTSTKMSVRVYSPAAGVDVKLKVEDHTNGANSVETDVLTTVANQWETLVFDFSNPASGTPAFNPAFTYDKASLFFDFGNSGTGAVYYWDDLQMAAPALSQIDWPVTFEDPTVDYTMTDFGGNSTTDATDPVNAGNHVKLSVKTAGAQVWAGTTIGTAAGFKTAIPVTSANSKMSVRVYSPAAGIDVKLKLEDHNNGSHSVETDVLTTVANQWETLVFDFNNPASGTPALDPTFTYDKASIFFDFGNTGDGRSYYWDDVKFPAANTLALPIDFELSGFAYPFTDFDGGAVTVISNPDQSGINSSAHVARMVKNAGQTWGGSYLTLPSPINFSAGQTFKMKVWSPRVGAKVLLKVENLTDGNVNYQQEVSTTTANAWEQLSFDFSGIDQTKTYQKIVLIFDNGTMGDGSANFTYYFDDISLN